MKNDCDFKRQLKWKFIPKYIVFYSKSLAKEKKQKKNKFRKPIKKLENSLGDANKLVSTTVLKMN